MWPKGLFSVYFSISLRPVHSFEFETPVLDACVNSMWQLGFTLVSNKKKLELSLWYWLDIQKAFSTSTLLLQSNLFLELKIFLLPNIALSLSPFPLSLSLFLKTHIHTHLCTHTLIYSLSHLFSLGHSLLFHLFLHLSTYRICKSNANKH